jgi:hypothetical protein
MLPHARGEPASIAEAFLEISLAMNTLVDANLDENVRNQVERLRALMDTSNVPHGSETGAWMAKAKGFSPVQRSEVSSLVDALASWFAEQARK